MKRFFRRWRAKREQELWDRANAQVGKLAARIEEEKAKEKEQRNEGLARFRRMYDERNRAMLRFGRWLRKEVPSVELDCEDPNPYVAEFARKVRAKLRRVYGIVPRQLTAKTP